MPGVKTIHTNKDVQVLKLEDMNVLSPKITIQSDAPMDTTESVYLLVVKPADGIDESAIVDMANTIADSIG